MRQYQGSSGFRARVMAVGLASSLALAGSFVFAQDAVTPQRSVSYDVGPASDSGLSGTLFIGEYAEDLSVVVLALRGTSANDVHPSHLHAGDCGSGGGVEIPLSDVAGSSGLGVTVVRVPYDELLAQDYHVNAHRAAADMGTIVACGEVGAAVAQAGAGDAAAAAAGQEAQMGLRSESYQLFAIEGSGVSGTLNVTEQVGGGTTFVVTAVGISPGETYLPVLFAGDCGPDRERLADLAPIGSIPEDPFASISQVSLSFDEVAEGDLFLYLYPEDGEGSPLACGEVGVGANR